MREVSVTARRIRLQTTVAGALSLALCTAACVPPPARVVAPVARPAREIAAVSSPGRRTTREMIQSSGLRQLHEVDPNATLAGIVSVVRGGSGADPAGAEGLAHMVEHLTYRAVDGAAASLTRWDRLTQLATAEMNGHTTPDCVFFYEFAAPHQLRGLLALAAARLGDPLAGVDERAFDLERQIIGSEHLVRADPRAGQWAVNALFPQVFPTQHPYARPTGGTVESRRNYTRADARAYTARTFRPQRMTVLVTAPPGAISLARIAALLPASLTSSTTPTPPDAPVSAPAAASAPPAPPAASPPPIAVERKSSPLSVPELWLAWTLPGGFGDLGPTEEVLGHWVESDIRSDQFAKEEPQIRHAGAWVQAGESASVLFVRAIVADTADVPHLAQTLAARVSSLWAREPEARPSFAGLRRAFETERILDEPGLPERAMKLALATALGGHPPPAAASPSSAEAVKSAAVAEFAYRNLTRERAHATFFATASPASGGEETRAATAAAREAAVAASATELIPGAAAWSPSQLGELLPHPPAITVAKLPTGLTVVTARRPGAAGVAWLGFRGGYSDADPPLLVELAVRARPEAWRAAALHILPARGATRDLSFDAVEFLPAQLPEALTVLFAKATATVTDWPAREDLQRRLASVASAEDPVEKKAERAFWRALFGDHRYARVVDTGELDRVARSDVDAWLGRVHNLREAALIVVGDVDAAEVQREAKVLSQQFKTPAWVAGLPTPPAALVRAAGSERVLPVLTPRAGGLVDIRLGCLLPPMAAGDRGRYELLAQAVESRLNTSLRIDQGDGYGVNVRYERLRDGTTYLLAATFVADPTLGRTLAALRSQWQRWGRDGFDAGEINVARWRYAASLSADYASANTFAFQLLHAWGVEPALLEPRNLRPDVAAENPARVGELFATCRANTVLGLTGNEPVIRRALEAGWPGLLTPAARHAGN